VPEESIWTSALATAQFLSRPVEYRPLRGVLKGMDLTRCPQCGTDYVSPLDCRSHDPEHLWIRLRCGECQAFSEAVVPNALAEQLEEDLERGMVQIAEELERVERETMVHDVELFVAALQHGLIEPADFL
jgi:hypothetical protein